MESLNSLVTFTNWLFLASIKAIVVVALVIIVQILFRKKLSAKWQHALWFLVIAKLVLPFEVPSPASIYNFLTAQKPILLQNPIVIQTHTVHSTPTTLQSQSIPPEPIVGPPLITDVNIHFTSVQILSLIWLFIVAILSIATFVLNRRMHKKLKNRQKVIDTKIMDLFGRCKMQMGINKVGLYSIQKSKTPMLYGLKSPHLLFPDHLLISLGEEELKHVFFHELAHYKRHDILIGFVTTFLQVLNWFNPVIWYAFYKMRMDRERACDELVLAKLGPEELAEYGRTLITLFENVSKNYYMPLAVGIVDSNNGLKGRLKMIMNYSKKPVWMTFVGIILMIVIGTFALTREKNKSFISGHINYESGAPTDTVYVGLYPLGSDRYLGRHEKLEKILSSDFAMEAEPGIYTLAIYSFEYELHRQDLYIPEKGAKVILEIDLPRVGIPAEFKQVKIKANYCNWIFADAVELTKENDIWRLKDTSILKKGERYQIVIDGLHRWDMNERNFAVIHSWTTINSLYSGGEITFDPKMFRQPMAEAKVKAKGYNDDNELRTMAQELSKIRDEVHEAEHLLGTLSIEQVDSMYLDFAQKFNILEKQFAGTFGQIFLEEKMTSLSHFHPIHFKMRNIWRESKGDTNKINAFYQSKEMQDFISEKKSLLERLDPESIFLEGRFIHDYLSLDYIIKKSKKTSKELGLNEGYFADYLTKFSEKAKNKTMAANIKFIVGSNLARSEDEKDRASAKIILNKLKEKYPENGNVEMGFVDDLLQSLKIVIGSKAPDFAVETLSGKSVKLSNLQGKFVFLDFWGSWCGPCRGEIPNLKKLYNSVTRDDLVILGLANDDSTKLCEYIKSEKIPYQNILAKKELLSEYGISAYPTTFLITPDGEIYAKNLRGEKLVDLVMEKMDEYNRKI
jgi:bla regulator protein blaR1